MIKVKLDKSIKKYIKSKAETLENRTVGIYFLKYNNEIVYIGQSIDIKARINTHLSEKTKVFNDFSFIKCDKELLNETETAYIFQYDPIFNKRDSLTDGLSLAEYCNDVGIEYYEHETPITGKEKTTLINMRIPNSILKDFDDMVAKNNLVPSRTAMIINMMDKEITKAKKKETK